MKTLTVGELIAGGGEAFKEFAEKKFSVKVTIEEGSLLLFNTNDHDLVMEIWTAYSKKDRDEVFAAMGLKP